MSKAYRLDPHLTARQLYHLCQDPDWWPWLDLIYGHPHAYEGLRAWIEQARLVGQRDLMPMVPEPGEEPQAGFLDRLRTPKHLPSPPVADGQWDDSVVVAGSSPQVVDVLTGPADSETIGSGDAPNRSEKDEEWDELMAPAASVRHGIRRRTILIAALAGVGVLALGAAGLAATGHHENTPSGEPAATASATTGRAACDAARNRMQQANDAWTLAQARGQSLLAQTDPDQVQDRATLDTLSDALKDTGGVIPACPTGDGQAMTAATDALNTAATRLETSTSRITDAIKKVEDSRLARTLAAARALYDKSAGKVQDEQVRKDLKAAIDAKDTDRIAKASTAVNDSMKAKSEADHKAARQAEEKRQDEASRQAEQAVPSVPQASVPQQSQEQQPVPQPTTVAPQPIQPQPAQSTPTWSVPDEQGDATLGNWDPGL